jgi:hypothetical protein
MRCSRRSPPQRRTADAGHPAGRILSAPTAGEYFTADYPGRKPPAFRIACAKVDCKKTHAIIKAVTKIYALVRAPLPMRCVFEFLAVFQKPKIGIKAGSIAICIGIPLPLRLYLPS